MKKPTAILLALSCAFILTACNPPKDDLKSYKPNVESLDQLRQVITWMNSSGTGFRFNLDPTADDWVQKFKSTPGQIEEIPSDIYEFRLEVNGKDWREYLGTPQFDAPKSDDKDYWQKGHFAAAKVLGGSKDIQINIVLPHYEGVEVQITNRSSKEVPLKLALPKVLEEGTTLKLNFETEIDAQIPVLAPGQTARIKVADTWLAWASMMAPTLTPPIRLTGPEDDVNALNALWFRFHTATQNDNFSLGPFGATSTRFNGHVFWDADVWWFPALALTNPQAAAQIPAFRFTSAPQAYDNEWNWIEDGRPIGRDQKLGGVPSDTGDSPPFGMKYPWESNVEGKEGGTTDTQFQEHVTADVAFMFQQAKALGLALQSKPDSFSVEDVLSTTKSHYQFWRGIFGAGPKELHHTVSPSEWHTVNNDLYTNALLEVVYGFDMKLPRDETTFLTFDDDKLKQYQQAAALLAVYPLQHPEVEAEADLMLKRFKDKAAKEGPAMSHSINAIIAARLGQTELAYDEWQKSWRNYTEDPWLNFREKPKYGESYFYTGAAGCLNAVYYGFMGLRLDRTKPKPGKPWQIALKNGWWLSAEPHLPKEWTKLELDIIVLEKPYTLIATHDGLTVKESKTSR